MVFKRKTVVEETPDNRTKSSSDSPSSFARDCGGICNPLNKFLTVCIFVILIIAAVKDNSNDGGDGSTSNTAALLKGTVLKNVANDAKTTATTTTAGEESTTTAVETANPAPAAITETTTTTATSDGKGPLEGHSANAPYVKALYEECDAAEWEKLKKFCPSCVMAHFPNCLTRAEFLMGRYQATYKQAAETILDQQPDECFI